MKNNMRFSEIIKSLKGNAFKKNIKTSKGRIYFRLNEELANKRFTLSEIESTETSKRMAIIISEKGNRKISKRKDGEKVHALIDLKDKETVEQFKNCNITLNVYEDIIVVEGTPIKENVSIQKNNILSFMERKDIEKTKRIVISRESIQNLEMKKVSGLNENQCSLFELIGKVENYAWSDTTSSSNIVFNKTCKQSIVDSLKVASFFSGMGGLDYAFKKEGYEIIFALDKGFYKDSATNIEKYGKHECSPLGQNHIETYRKNFGNHIVSADILTYPLEQIPVADVYLFGIPCVELSSVSRSRNQFDMTPKFISRFIEIMKHVKDHAKAFVIENSINLLGAGRHFLEEIKQELPWFNITENGVDAADFGAAQHRERAIIIGTIENKVELKPPALKVVKTVRTAFEGLTNQTPNQDPEIYASKSGEDTIERMSYVPQGGNWQDIPESIRKKGKFANYHRRLHMDDVSCAIVNIRKSLLTHPLYNRGLTIRECLRLFGFEDDFIVYGDLGAMQQMVANSVPVELGRAIAKSLKHGLV